MMRTESVITKTKRVKRQRTLYSITKKWSCSLYSKWSGNLWALPSRGDMSLYKNNQKLLETVHDTKQNQSTGTIGYYFYEFMHIGALYYVSAGGWRGWWDRTGGSWGREWGGGGTIRSPSVALLLLLVLRGPVDIGMGMAFRPSIGMRVYQEISTNQIPSRLQVPQKIHM